jgi:DNA-binding XRE family transcriptional regulator
MFAVYKLGNVASLWQRQTFRLALAFAICKLSVAMNAPDHIAPDGAELSPIAALRGELGLTQLEFGERIGLANKASVSLLERGLIPCSLRVALAIEELSGRRIDAAMLCEDVRLARGPVSAVAEADAEEAA